MPHYQHVGMVKSTTSKYKMPAAAILDFRLCEIKKNVCSSGLDEDICIKFYGIMHWTLAYTTVLWLIKPYGSTSCSHSLNYSKLQ